MGGYENTMSYDVHYSSQGAMNVICCINGHHHVDMIKPITSESDINQIYIACDGMDGSACYRDESGNTVYYDRTKGTITEHIIDTLVYNKKDNTITMKRLGVGSDRVLSL